MSDFTKYMMEFEDFVDGQVDDGMTLPPATASEINTALDLLQDLMGKYKEYCDCCAQAWKVDEVPSMIRKKLITLDQINQLQYQKLYALIGKYREALAQTEIKKLGV